MSNIKLIAFDLDGTLLDSVPDLAVAADQAVQALGYPAVTEEQVRITSVTALMCLLGVR